VWNRVHEAQSIALVAARAGIIAREVDRAARTFLDIMGLGWYFTHRLGHGGSVRLLVFDSSLIIYFKALV
jgi:Xaa-Pro aminopeptidase